MQFTISWRIPSKKNCKQIVMRWKYPKLISSKAYLQWEELQVMLNKKIKLNSEPPYKIVCEFYMPDLRKTDLSNKFESIADMLVTAWVLKDDNYDILSIVELIHKWLDRENPRVEIEITSINKYEKMEL